MKEGRVVPWGVSPTRGLIEGRIVHYVLGNGEHRPAIVVKVWDEGTEGNGSSNLQVFLDGTNDLIDNTKFPYIPCTEEAKAGIMWRTSVTYNQVPTPNTWHWIEKAP